MNSGMIIPEHIRQKKCMHKVKYINHQPCFDHGTFDEVSWKTMNDKYVPKYDKTKDYEKNIVVLQQRWSTLTGLLHLLTGQVGF